jgi:hypothetical protein
MKVEVLSEFSELGKTKPPAKNCKSPFPGFRIVIYDFEYVPADGGGTKSCLPGLA